MIITSLLQQLERDEGRRYVWYLDSKGNPTIGVGHLILPTEQWLKTVTLTDAQVDSILAHDIQIATDAITPFGWFNALDEVRQGGVLNMVFNMGQPKLMRFSSMIHGLSIGDWTLAHDEALNSDWARELHYNPANPLASRPGRIATQFLTGTWQ